MQGDRGGKTPVGVRFALKKLRTLIGGGVGRVGQVVVKHD